MLTNTHPDRIHGRLSALFQREVGPDLAALERARRHYRLGFVAALAAMLAIVFAVFVLVPDLQRALPAGIIVVAIGILLMQAARRGYSHRARQVVMPAICAAIGDVSHDTGAAAELNFDLLTQVGLVPGHNRRRIDDVFRGRHRATGFTMAEVRLQRVRHHRRRSRGTAFRGLILAIEVPRPVAAQILIATDGGWLGNSLKGWIKSLGNMRRVTLPDEAFEARFEVYADRPEVAKATLTPELCANLVALAAAQNGPAFQAAFAGDRFIMALPVRGDQFRLGSLFRSADTLEEDAARVLDDVRLAHRIIDTLHGERPPLSASDASSRPAQGRDQGPGPIVRC